MNDDEDTKKRFKLLLVLNACDNNMLRNLLETNVKNETITMNKIESELLMIQSFCGKEDYYALESIEWESGILKKNKKKKKKKNKNKNK